MNSDKLFSPTDSFLNTKKTVITQLTLSRFLKAKGSDDLVADAKNPKKSYEQVLKETSLEIDGFLADVKNPEKSLEQKVEEISLDIVGYNDLTKGILRELPVDIYSSEGGAGCTMFGGAQDIKEEEKNAVLKK